MQPTARSLVLDLLSTLRRGTMPVRALVEAGAILGIEENNIRVSLARLYASGRIERDERGRYRLGPAVAAMGEELKSWRDLTRGMRSWRGDWIAVQQSRLGRGAPRRRRDRALDLLGFRSLDAGLWLRPDNLRGGVEAMRDRWHGLTDAALDPSARGQSATHSDARLCILRDLDPTSDLAARRLWDEEDWARTDREALARLIASEERVAQMSETEAMAETFLVGGRVLRQLIRHPLLPEPILDPAPLRTLLVAMKRYDELGRNHWARFLASHDVPHRTLPMDRRHGSHEPELSLH